MGQSSRAPAISWLRRAWHLGTRSTPRTRWKPDATGSSAQILTLTSWLMCPASARPDLTRPARRTRNLGRLPLGYDASEPRGELGSGHGVALKDGGHLTIQGALIGVGQLLGGQNHDGDGARGLLFSQRLDDVETGQARHHQVEQDQVGNLRR